MVSLSGESAYLDASTIIYALEGLARFGNLKAVLLDRLDAGELVAVTSQLTLVETLVRPRKAGDLRIEQTYRVFLQPSRSLSVEPITLAVLERVVDLRARFGFKIPDAIHLATGMAVGCTVFVTGDAQWARAGVRVVHPADLA